MKSACKKTRKTLVAFITRQTKEQNARDVAEHLASCPLCSREAEELQSTWELMGKDSIDEYFRDIAGAVVEKARRADDTETLLGKTITLLLRIPAPALCTFIAVLALPAGIYLGKNLHLNLSADASAYRAEEVAAESEELPLDIFSDFPAHSLGEIHEDLSNDS